MSGSGSAQELAGGISWVKAETLNAERAIANSKTSGIAANRMDVVKAETLKFKREDDAGGEDFSLLAAGGGGVVGEVSAGFQVAGQGAGFGGSGLCGG